MWRMKIFTKIQTSCATLGNIRFCLRWKYRGRWNLLVQLSFVKKDYIYYPVFPSWNSLLLNCPTFYLRKNKRCHFFNVRLVRSHGFFRINIKITIYRKLWVRENELLRLRQKLFILKIQIVKNSKPIWSTLYTSM